MSEKNDLKNSLLSVGAKPAGLEGIVAGKVMNIIHTGFYTKIINRLLIPDSNTTRQVRVLDVGCGGGAAVKAFSCHKSVSEVCGIDHSEEMVRLSRKLNQKKIEKKSVDILKADVIHIPYNSNSFNIVTAFDTINFWHDHTSAIREVWRVLRKNGTFSIINAYPKPGTKWYQFTKFKSCEEYEEFLLANGFSGVSSMFIRNTIIVMGTKL